MAGRNYERLPIEDFGRQLLLSGDLDPVYIALPKAIDNFPQMYRWLIAYWCFYHCGVASYMSALEGQEFFRQMHHAAVNKRAPYNFDRWPRGSERRHARGQQAINMVLDLRHRYGNEPERMVTDLIESASGGAKFVDVARRVKTHTLFGPWIAFKVCDMLERCLGCNIDFEEADVFMFRDPMKAAEMLYRKRQGVPGNVKVKMEVVVPGIVRWLKDEFQDLKAPPTYNRPVSLQEVETVLCKFKSHLNGHYPLFNDIDEICEGLKGWGTTADAFLMSMPRGSHGS